MLMPGCTSAGARCATTDRDVRAGPRAGVAGWLTWRNGASMGGGLAFGGLAGVAAAYTAMRLLGIGPVGTLVASGVLKDRDPLVLADFENRTRRLHPRASLTEAFRVDLSQSPTVRLSDRPGSRRRAAADAAPDAASPLPPALAREIAEREGVEGGRDGTDRSGGEGLRPLREPGRRRATARVLTAVRETADGDGALLAAIDRLSKKLRERIGESLTSIRANAPLEQVTTGSLDAAAEVHRSPPARSGRPARGRRSRCCEDAVALDTGFAMAWRKLAVLLGNRTTRPAARLRRPPTLSDSATACPSWRAT